MIVIHIGPHKTATTSIQDFFENNSFASFKYISRNSSKFNSLQKYLHKRMSLNTLVSKLGFSTKKNYFISNENLSKLLASTCTHRQKVLINELNKNHDIKIVYYLRNYKDLVKSIFYELYRGGDLREFSEFINSKPINEEYNLKLDKNGFIAFSNGLFSDIDLLNEISKKSNGLMKRETFVLQSEKLKVRNIIEFILSSFNENFIDDFAIQHQRKSNNINIDLIHKKTVLQDYLGPGKFVDLRKYKLGKKSLKMSYVQYLLKMTTSGYDDNKRYKGFRAIIDNYFKLFLKNTHNHIQLQNVDSIENQFLSDLNKIRKNRFINFIDMDKNE